MESKHSRYIVVFAAMLLQAIPYGIAQNIPPLFVAPLRNSYHFSLGDIGWIFTIGAVAASLSAPLMGRLFRSYPVKLIMFGGIVLSASGVILNTFATDLWMFLATNAITQIGTITFSGLGVPYLIGTWFTGAEKAKALGIAFSGGSIGNFFLQPGVEYLLSHNRVSRVYLIVGLISLIGGLIVLFTMVKTNTSKNSSGKEENKLALNGIGYSKAMRVKEFWGLAFGYGLIGLSVAALSIQYAAYFRHLGISSHIIGMVGSVFAVSCLCGNLLGGVLFARFGIVKAMSFAFVFQLLAIFSMLFGLVGAQWSVTAAFAWAAVYGFNVFSYTSAPALIVQGLFGMKQSSEVLGVFSIFFAVGFAIGNVIFGIVVDVSGYYLGWITVLGYTLVGFFALLFFAHRISLQKYADVLEEDAQKSSVTA
ncbi:conjugated bile salt MFS transporter [Actinomycetaceae bacterium TAE3-ERU4]|nr:conjugated bile salt MFS transporter [Actinomycetaceae bacterium TAE3-ERU4]